MIDDAFENDKHIDELGVILSNEPPFVVVIDHKLGVSMGILKPLFLLCKDLLETNLDSIDENYLKSKEMISFTRAILLVKGDFPPALSIRKKLIMYNFLSVDEELHFLAMIFSKHPKSPSAWYHRKWCLSHGRENVSLSSSTIAIECQLCSRNCDSYSRNYYSWNHRLWIASMMNIAQVSRSYLVISQVS